MLRRIALPALCLLAACDLAPREVRAAPAAPAPAGWSAPRDATALSAAIDRRASPAAAVMDRDGTLHAVFAADTDHDGWADALQYARLDSAGWSAPVALVQGGALAESPQLAVDGDGALHLLWYTHRGTASRPDVPTELVHRVMRGGAWSPARVLYREPLDAGIPDLSLSAATGPDGAVEVLFQAQGRGTGHLTLRDDAASAPEFLDHDGRMTAFAAAPPGDALTFAYIGEAVSPLLPSAENDVFVRPLRSRLARPEVEVHAVARRYSHFPQMVKDDDGGWQLFWLEDTDGDVFPQALFHAASRDGREWSEAEDVTPAALRGGVFFRAAAARGADGRIHLLLRHTRGPGQGDGLYALTLGGGAPSPLVTLAAPGRLGGGDAQLVPDPRGGRVVALWRGADGQVRWAARGS